MVHIIDGDALRTWAEGLSIIAEQMVVNGMPQRGVRNIVVDLEDN